MLSKYIELLLPGGLVMGCDWGLGAAIRG